MIVEIAGRPGEYVKEMLSKHVSVFKDIKDIEVNSIKISEPKEIEGSKGVFTCFSEVDITVPNLLRLTEIVFDFMPSSIDIIEPSKVSFDLNEVNSLLNNLSGKLHRYDELAKVAHFKINQLNSQIEALKKGNEKDILKEDKVKKESKKGKNPKRPNKNK